MEKEVFNSRYTYGAYMAAHRGKVEISNEAEAQREVKRLQRAHGGVFNAYICLFGDLHWHVGHSMYLSNSLRNNARLIELKTQLESEQS